MILFIKKNDLSFLFLSYTTITIYLICVLGISNGSVLATDVLPPPLETLFNEMEQSTVKVVNTIPTNLFNPQAQNQTELGTGFVFDDDEHIITAYHVLSGATTVNVITNEGERYEARLLGADPYSDVAVLEIERKIRISNETSILPTLNGDAGIGNITLKHVMMGNSSSLSVGDPVVAIGYGFGSSSPSMTGGLVSMTDYLLAFPAGGFSIPNMIQSDAIVNPGDSGGPLVDPTRKVIGMIYGRLNPVGVPLGQFPGITVAIPSNIVNKVASSIVEKGFYLHPGIGIMGETVSSDLVERLASSINITSTPQGVFVNRIERNGTADLAGIHGSATNEYGEILSGDVITAIDGIPVTKFEDLLSYVQEHKSVGDQISFTIYRNGQILKLQGVVLTFHPFGQM
jgi:S1-C subfamily serine protease